MMVMVGGRRVRIYLVIFSTHNIGRVSAGDCMVVVRSGEDVELTERRVDC